MDHQNQVTTPQGSISSTSGLPSARNRPRRPCDACRKRKSRCEIAEGEIICVLCKFHRQPCLFQENPQPRKKRKISADGIEVDGGSRDINRNLPLPLEQTDGPGAHEEAERRVSIRQHQPIDDYANLKGPSLLKKTLGLQNHRHSKFIGSTSPFEQSLLSQATFDDKDEIPLGPSVLRKVNESTSFVLVPDQSDHTVSPFIYCRFRCSNIRTLSFVST
jgi:hypothetical protein